MEQRLEQLVNRLEKAVAALEKGGKPSAAAAGDDVKNPYTDFMHEKLDPILPLAAPLPEKVQQMTKLFVDCHTLVDTIVGMSLKCKKPAPAELQKVHEPIAKAVAEIEKLGGYKQDPQFNHGQLLKEAARTASWVLNDRTPADYVDNTFQVGEFYGLKVVQEFKTKEPAHVKWFHAIKDFCLGLQEFVRENYRTGLEWKPNGVSIAEFSPAAASAAPAPAPAPAASSTAAPAAAPKPAINPAAFMKELQQGTAITGRLRKVQDSEKTKNRPPEERVSTVPSELGPKKTPAPAAAPKFGAKPAAPPKFEQRGTKLNIENHTNNQELKFDSQSIQQTIYMYNCKNCAFVVTGKINQMVLDKCTKCKIVVDEVISSFEIINSRDVDVQIIKVCASVLVESSESARIYVSEEGMKKVEVYSSKSSSVCVYAPGKRIDPDTEEEIEDMIEHALPSTLRSVFENGALSHSFVKHG